MGRPKKAFDLDQFEKLCALHCTKEEIAAWFDFSEDTLEARMKEHYDSTFSVVFRQKRSGGRVSLRRKMMEGAMGGNVALLIFLSKNLLGYGDRVVTETGKENEQSKLVIDFGADDLPPV